LATVLTAAPQLPRRAHQQEWPRHFSATTQQCTCASTRVCLCLCVALVSVRLLRVVSVHSFSLCHAGCVGRSHKRVMCMAGRCPVCRHRAYMCVWLVCGVADGSPGDAPFCAQIWLLDAGGVVSQACITCACQWYSAGVVACCACSYALCAPFVGAALSCRLLELGAPRRPSLGASSLLSQGFGPTCQVLCSRGLP
jgi:hypothetical protein